MVTDRGAQQRGLPAVVAEELLQAADGQRGSVDLLPPEDQLPGPARAVWRRIAVFGALSAVFLLLCWGELFDALPAGLSRHLPLTLAVLLAAWLPAGFVALDRAVKLGHLQVNVPLLGYWPYYRWVYFGGAVLGPVLGQLWSLWAAIKNFRASRNTVAAVYLILAVGWPAMFASAFFALAPATSLSTVTLAGGKGQLTVELRPEHHFTALSSITLVYGSGGVLWAVMALAGLGLRRQQLRRARVAAGAATAPELLAPGEVLLRGEVELAEGACFAVRCEMIQRGQETEDEDGDWSHWWEAEHQEIKVNPFFLRLPSGSRVRVEGDPQVIFRHPMSRTEPIRRDRRRRIAELTSGQEVSVSGILSRSKAPEDQVHKRWLLRPASRSSMIISSTPLERPFKRRARLYGRMALLVSLCGIAGHLLLLPFYLSLWTGESATAEVLTASYKAKTMDDAEVFSLGLELPDGREIFQRVGSIPEAQWSRISAGATLPVRLVPAWPSRAQVGAWPTAFFPLALALALAIWVVGRWLLYVADLGEDWYEADDFTEMGTGRLPEA